MSPFQERSDAARLVAAAEARAVYNVVFCFCLDQNNTSRIVGSDPVDMWHMLGVRCTCSL
jgi:hypothetical protein